MNSLLNGIRSKLRPIKCPSTGLWFPLAVISTPAPIRPCVIVTLDNTIWLGMVNLVALDIGECGVNDKDYCE